MSNINLCRVCLASNTRMHNIANTRYQEIFEKLSTKLCTEDGRPETMCYICFSQLQNCCKFVDMSRKAEEILTQFSLSGIELSEDTVAILDRKFVRKISWTPFQYLSINDSSGSQLKLQIKEEPTGNIVQYSVNENTIAENEQPSEKEKQLYEKQITIIVKEEPISESEQVSLNMNAVTEEETPLIDKQKIIIVKEEPISEKKQLPVKEERIKQELIEYGDGEFAAEVEDATKYNGYEEVSLTDPEEKLRKLYQCNLCDKGYNQKCHLNRHIKVHRPGPSGTQTRDYTCEKCGRAFIQKSTLKVHLLCHNLEKRYTCEHCPTKCNRKIDMERHMRMHTGLKPFKCDVCKMRFSRKSNLKLHILTHADVKPFLCNLCDYTFSRQYDLKRHVKRKHTGEKPYSCNICDFRSVNASYVKTHMENRHLKPEGVKPFSCELCEFKCSSSNYLKLHMSKRHLSENVKSKTVKIKKVF